LDEENRADHEEAQCIGLPTDGWHPQASNGQETRHDDHERDPAIGSSTAQIEYAKREQGREEYRREHDQIRDCKDVHKPA
jgi:hypothetical protein